MNHSTGIGLATGLASIGVIVAAVLGAANMSQTSELELRVMHAEISSSQAVQAAEAVSVRLDRTGASVLDISAVAAALDTPCPTEDSNDCFWLGGENGEGTSFLNVSGNIFPLSEVEESR